MTRSVLFAAVLVLVPGTSQDPIDPFVPFAPRAYRVINGVAFLPGDAAFVSALLYRDVLAHRGRPDSTAAELGLFLSHREGDAWSEPALLPFSGNYPDYEPALAPDGSFLVFNSKRPYPDGRVPARNDLWFVTRHGDHWGTPRALSELNSFDLEESYATVDQQRRMVFVRGPTREGGDDYDLYETVLEPTGQFSAPRQLPFSNGAFGEGDPQLALDGSYLIFTRWDLSRGWQESCDLYITFRRGESWSEPVALTRLNTERPDYAAALSSDGRWLYYRSGGRYVRRPLAEALSGLERH